MNIYQTRHVFVKHEWCAQACHDLAEALPPNAEDKEFIADQVRRGVAQLFRVDDHSWLITRVEFPGPELVIVAYAGKRVRSVMQHVFIGAKREKIRSIRFHTQHVWLPKIFGDVELEPLEYVMRVKL